MAIRDRDVAAASVGIHVARYKLAAFVWSSVVTALAGTLFAYQRGFVSVEAFGFFLAIEYIAMIIIGGLGSVLGSILGAVFVTLLPIVIRILMENVGSLFFTAAEMANVISGLRLGVFGALIIFFLIVEPEGLNRLWRNIRSYFRVWPFSY